MKKITLASMLIFLFIAGYFYVYGLNNSLKDKQSIPASNENKLDTIINTGTANNSKNPAHDINPLQIDISRIQYQLEQSNKSSITLSEVAQHSSRSDCYLVINNNVYDVSSYIMYHPGGSRTITSRCGKEVTSIFARIHSNRAWDLLGRYKIGTANTGKQDVTALVLDAISKSLQKENPDAEIVNVRPKHNFYVAKIIQNGKLYEVHIDNSGKIIKEEVESDEFDWSLWDTDLDDKQSSKL